MLEITLPEITVEVGNERVCGKCPFQCDGMGSSYCSYYRKGLVESWDYAPDAPFPFYCVRCDECIANEQKASDKALDIIKSVAEAFDEINKDQEGV